MTIVSRRLEGDTVVRFFKATFLFFIIAFTFSPRINLASGLSTNSSSSLILWMPLVDASVPIQDLSSYDNHGTPNGGVAWSSEAGGSYSFDGVDDYINRATVIGLSPQQLTFSYWSKQTATSTGFMHTVGLFGGHRATVYVSPDSYLYVYKFDSVSGTSYEAPIGTLDGEWHHTAVVFDGSRLRVYVDGAERVDVYAPGVIDKVDDSLFIGTTGTGSAGAANNYKGFLDGVLIHSRALSAREIQTEYLLTKFSMATGYLQLAYRAVHDAEIVGGDVSSLMARLNEAAQLVNAGGAENIAKAITICEDVKTESSRVGAAGIQAANIQLITVGITLVILCILGVLIWLKLSDWFWATWLRNRRGWRFEKA